MTSKASLHQCNAMWGNETFISIIMPILLLPLLNVVWMLLATTSSLLSLPLLLVIESKVSKFQCIIIIKLIQKTWFVKRFASAIEKFNWLNNFGGGHHWCVKLPKHVFRRVGFYAYIYTQVCFFKNTYLLKYELNKLDNFKKYVSVI